MSTQEFPRKFNGEGRIMASLLACRSLLDILVRGCVPYTRVTLQPYPELERDRLSGSRRLLQQVSRWLSSNSNIWIIMSYVRPGHQRPSLKVVF
jgi:hypothetical protein